jgi:hypothetical protein
MTDGVLYLLVRSIVFVNHAVALLGMIAAVLGGLLAAYASWHLTDRFVIWWQRAH